MIFWSWCLCFGNELLFSTLMTSPKQRFSSLYFWRSASMLRNAVRPPYPRNVSFWIQAYRAGQARAAVNKTGRVNRGVGMAQAT
jgi:hypothetical protein